MRPYALQLYSVRDAFLKDAVTTLKRVADIGYQGVEPVYLDKIGMTLKEFRRRVEDLGMAICSTHFPRVDPDGLPGTIDSLGELGADTIVTEGVVTDRKAIEDTAARFETMDRTLRAAGVTLAIHNHWAQFERLDGRLKFDIQAELAPNVRFELDVYWAANFGANDPAHVVKQYAERCPLLHIKDGTLVRDRPLRPVGSGKLNIPAIIRAAGPATKWLIVEQDDGETDMFQCVESSYRYLVDNGLGKGKRT
jgi:sugar phosphate isomerase/epimerase